MTLVADLIRNARKAKSQSRGADSGAEWLLEAHYWLGLAGIAATLPTALGGPGDPEALAEEISKALAEGP